MLLTDEYISRVFSIWIFHLYTNLWKGHTLGTLCLQVHLLHMFSLWWVESMFFTCIFSIIQVLWKRVFRNFIPVARSQYELPYKQKFVALWKSNLFSFLYIIKSLFILSFCFEKYCFRVTNWRDGWFKCSKYYIWMILCSWVTNGKKKMKWCGKTPSPEASFPMKLKALFRAQLFPFGGT